MITWGKRKDGQAYPKDGKKGIKGSITNPVSDVHMRMPNNLKKLMNIEHERTLVQLFSGTSWFDLEYDLSKFSDEDKRKALEIIKRNFERIKGNLRELRKNPNPDEFEKSAIEHFEREIEVDKAGIKQLERLLNISDEESDYHFRENEHYKKQEATISYKDITGKTHHTHPNSTVTQTILLSRDEFTESEAKKWLKENDKATDLDIKENTFRARQVSPSKFKPDSLRTIYIGKGKKIVIGKLKT